MAVALSTSMVSDITAFANPLLPQIHNTQDDDPGVTPYYLYIQTLDVMVEPGPSEITYNIAFTVLTFLNLSPEQPHCTNETALESMKRKHLDLILFQALMSPKVFLSIPMGQVSINSHLKELLIQPTAAQKN